MNERLADALQPKHCALVLQEVQEGVVGRDAVFPDLAAVAAEIALIEHCAALAHAARAVGIPVFHCTAETRADLLGANTNARLFGAARKAGSRLAPGSDGVRVPSVIGVDERDVVLPRHHGVGPLTGTQLDPMLRNAGVRTIIAAGVSLNVGVLDLIITGVNLGYQMVVPVDAVAGVPREYGDAVLANTISVLAMESSTSEIIEAWVDLG
ncbi:MAG: cysteine hydrolase family protein [Acidimicrobiia bacterium]